MYKKIDEMLTVITLIAFLVGFGMSALRIDGGMQTMIISGGVLFQLYLINLGANAVKKTQTEGGK